MRGSRGFGKDGLGVLQNGVMSALCSIGNASFTPVEEVLFVLGRGRHGYSPARKTLENPPSYSSKYLKTPACAVCDVAVSDLADGSSE